MAPPLLIFLVLIAVPLPFALWFWLALTPLQKQYLPTYAVVSMSGSMGMREPVWWVWKTAPRRPPELAHDGDAIAATYPGHPPLALSLSPQARAAGWAGLIQARQLARPELTAATLHEQFFAGESAFRDGTPRIAIDGVLKTCEQIVEMADNLRKPPSSVTVAAAKRRLK